jgi:hypothetical protein
MNPEAIGVLSNANTRVRATRLLHWLEAARQGRVACEQEKALVGWLSQQLVASRRGAETAAPINRIQPDQYEYRTSFTSENKLYRAFRAYSNAQNPREHAQWVDAAVDALRTLADESWEHLDDTKRDEIVDVVIPLVRRLRETSGRDVLSRDAPLATV